MRRSRLWDGTRLGPGISITFLNSRPSTIFSPAANEIGITAVATRTARSFLNSRRKLGQHVKKKPSAAAHITMNYDVAIAPSAHSPQVTSTQ